MARAKNLLSAAVIHLASVGRSSGVSIFGCSPWRNLAGTILAPSGRPPPFFFVAKPDSPTEGTAPPLAAPFAVPATLILMKEEAIAQYFGPFQSVDPWVLRRAQCSCPPNNIRATLAAV